MGFYGNAEFGDIRLRKVEDQGIIIPDNKDKKQDNVSSGWLSDYKETKSFAPNTFVSNVYFDETLKESLDERFNKEGFHAGKDSGFLTEHLSSIIPFYQIELERKESNIYLFSFEESKYFEHKLSSWALGFIFLLIPINMNRVCFINDIPQDKSVWNVIETVDNDNLPRLGVEFTYEIPDNSIVQLKFRESSGGAIGINAKTWGGGSLGQNAISAFGGSVGCNASSGLGFSGGYRSSVFALPEYYIYKNNNDKLILTLGASTSFNSCGAAIGANATSIGSGGAVGLNSFTSSGGAIGDNAISLKGGALGNKSFSLNGGSLGSEAFSGNGFSGGYQAKTAFVEKITFDVDSTMLEIIEEDEYDSVNIDLSSFQNWIDNKEKQCFEYGQIIKNDFSIPIIIQKKSEVGVQIKIDKNHLQIKSEEKIELEIQFYEDYESVAIGLQAEALVKGAVQLGTGKNEKEGSLQFKNYTIMTNDGAYVVSSNWYGTTLPETGNFEEGQLFFKI